MGCITLKLESLSLIDQQTGDDVGPVNSSDFDFAANYLLTKKAVPKPPIDVPGQPVPPAAPSGGAGGTDGNVQIETRPPQHYCLLATASSGTLWLEHCAYIRSRILARSSSEHINSATWRTENPIAAVSSSSNSGRTSAVSGKSRAWSATDIDRRNQRAFEARLWLRRQRLEIFIDHLAILSRDLPVPAECRSH